MAFNFSFYNASVENWKKIGKSSHYSVIGCRGFNAMPSFYSQMTDQKGNDFIKSCDIYMYRSLLLAYRRHFSTLLFSPDLVPSVQFHLTACALRSWHSGWPPWHWVCSVILYQGSVAGGTWRRLQYSLPSFDAITDAEPKNRETPWTKPNRQDLQTMSMRYN